MTVEIGVIVARMPKTGSKIAFGFIYGMLFITMMILWYITTKIDPTDGIQLLHRQSLIKKK